MLAHRRRVLPVRTFLIACINLSAYQMPGVSLLSDYQGARGAGMESLLLRRPDYDYADEVGEGVTPPLLTSLEALPQLLDDTTLGES
jgi:hypothetical protein